jgi:hypothetical protein
MAALKYPLNAVRALNNPVVIIQPDDNAVVVIVSLFVASRFDLVHAIYSMAE